MGVEACAFCDIVKSGDSTNNRIFYKDDKFNAILDKYPRTPGHFLVFPTFHASELSKMVDDLPLLIATAYNLAETVTSHLKAPAYELKINNNVYKLSDDPLHVGHIHMHVVPVYPDSKSPETSVDFYEQFLNLFLRE